MGKDQGKDSNLQISAELRKYIRVQTVGMAFVLAWPVAMMLADMYGLTTFIPIISVLMVFAGVIIFAIGHVGRQELRERNMRE